MSTSDAEALLAWQLEHTGVAFEQQHRFHPTRKWRLDFWIKPHKLAVEVNGGAYPFKDKRTGEMIVGRHTRGKGFEEDCTKYSECAILGWRLIHVTPAMVTDGRALRLIERALEGTDGQPDEGAEARPASGLECGAH